MKYDAVQKSKLFHQLNRPYIILPCDLKQNLLFQNGKKKRKQPVHNFDRSCQGGFTQFYRTSLRQVCPAWKNINPATVHAAAAQTCSRPEPDPSSPPPRFPGQERGWRRATPIPPPPAAVAAAGDPCAPPRLFALFISPSPLPSRSPFPGGDDWASGGAIRHVFLGGSFAGDKCPPGMPSPSRPFQLCETEHPNP